MLMKFSYFRSVFSRVSNHTLCSCFPPGKYFDSYGFSSVKTNLYRLRVNSYFTMKVDTPEFHQIFTDELKTLLDIFHKYNYEIRIAGGAVRDLLMGKAPNDVDFATNATPDEMKQMFNEEKIRMINTKGEKHGTITARINTENFEVTTLRIDVTTDGRHAEVEFTKDWELDANRRDFTINSMFLGPDGTLYDYCNGYNDLMERKVTFVSDAKTRIIEDYLRILRYFRFYGKISEKENNHDEETLKTIADNIDGLEIISGERIWVELRKILLGNYAPSIMEAMIQCGAAKYIGLPDCPDIQSMKILLEKTKGMDILPITIVTSLLQDSTQFEVFHTRCKLSNEDKHIGLFIIENRHLEETLKYFQVLLLTPRLIPVTRKQITELFKYTGDLTKLNDFDKWETPKLPVNGHDLLAAGLPPGKQLGNVMNQLKMHWINKDFQAEKEELISLIPSIAQDLKIKLINKSP